VSQTKSQPTATAHFQVSIVGVTRRAVRADIAGELDTSNSHILQVRLLAALRDRHPAVLDLDLTDLTFMDCSTVSALVRIRATAERSGCRMRILNPRSVVVRMLDALDLLEVFSVVSGQRTA
jgi:anti-anti-sigma factor